MGFSSGKVSAQPIQPSLANSAFSGLNNFTVGLDGIGASETIADTNQIKTQFRLDPALRATLEQAKQGLGNALGVTNRSLAQEMADIRAGLNPFYNAQQAINAENALNSQKALQARLSQSGLGASTVLGGFAAQLARDAQLIDLATQREAIDQAFSRGVQQLNANNQVLGQITGVQSQPTQLTTSGLMDGLNARDANNRFNAGQIQSASEVNSRLALQAALANQQAAIERQRNLISAASTFSNNLPYVSQFIKGGGGLTG